MLFNSPEFLFAFLPVFLIVYFAAPRKLRNLVLFAASLSFYYTTSGQLTAVLILSVVLNYVIGIQLERMRINESAGRRAWLFVGVAINLAPLIYYKYSRFAVDSANDAFRLLALRLHLPSPNPILPIGISFFTFQAISYICDVYSERVRPSRNLIDFGMYHSCFPQLIAGPIVRYEEIEPQIRQRVNRLDDVFDGVVRFCFGLGKKVVLADNMGKVANWAFGLPAASLDTVSAWCGIIAYTLQIYFDFSGYSDMAIGLGRILGFPYPENFNQPYRSLSVTEFWRRWHMTLSRWFKDYVYIPLGGNRGSLARTLCNLCIVFFLCGLWHGAGYTFIVWGACHGTLLIGERLAKRWVRFRVAPLLGWIYTITAIMISWVFFRADTMTAALSYIKSMFNLHQPGISEDLVSVLSADRIAYMLVAILLALLPLPSLGSLSNRRDPAAAGVGIFALAVAMLAIVLMSVNGFSPFIYFRF